MTDRINDQCRIKFRIDPAHGLVDIFNLDISKDIWRDKYRYESVLHQPEKDAYDTMWRICQGIHWQDTKESCDESFAAMAQGLFIPGGRINAGAGTNREVTLHNCYVCGTVQDSMEGIADALKEVMITLKKGGGIGTDFSTLRPKNAEIKRLGSGAYSSGAVSFMKIWNAASATIMSAGSRRGAMMATLRCDHPDIEDFIAAKHEKGVLEHFNVSVLVTDAFMDAVKHDTKWMLMSEHSPASPYKAEAKIGNKYVYKTVSARQLWEKILRSTYDYAEPGVIFIDRVNRMNNLYYCETINCTNPCGEQPLPPWGACNLGHINLARMVDRPFEPNAQIGWALLDNVVKTAVRFLDNVIDVSTYAVEQQKIEQTNKRRIGLGVTGLANALDMLGIRYGSQGAVELAEEIQERICYAAYSASIALAHERGNFLAFNRQEYVRSGFMRNLTDDMRKTIEGQGIRNSLLLTQAPVGTGSLWFGNTSSGIEPVFAHSINRRVLQPNNEWKTYTVEDYGVRLWRTLFGDRPLPNHMITSDKLTVKEHVDMQAAVQRFVDASISKTINCAESLSFEEFADVYTYAYEKGCKGVTTYRPSKISREVRGSILESTDKPVAPNLEPPHLTATPLPVEAAKPAEESVRSKVLVDVGEDTYILEPRPKVLSGKTYQLKWPHREAAVYMTINDMDGRPHEVLFTSRSMQDMPWMIALGRMLAAMLRLEIDVHFICDELEDVRDAYESAWINGKQYGSIVALIGATLREHLEFRGNGGSVVVEVPNAERREDSDLRVCPKCTQKTLMKSEGCDKCFNCGYSRC